MLALQFLALENANHCYGAQEFTEVCFREPPFRRVGIRRQACADG